MAYIVDVNDYNQPSNAKPAGQAAEELRAIKLKISGFIRNNDASYVFSVPTRFDAGLETSALKTTSAEITGALTVGDIQSSTFVGMLADFPSAVLKAGWLKCNGAAVSRTTYAALFAYIGTAYGAGDGVTTFNLPDYRGEFRRSWDDGRGLDTGRVIGSVQTDLTKAHSHEMGNVWVGGGAELNINGAENYTYSRTSGGGGSDRNLYTSRTSTSVGTETRPRNMAVMTCIKY